MSVIMKLTGHKTIVMFTRYNTVDRDDARLAMEMLGGFLEEEKCSHSAPGGVGIKNQGPRLI
jgi:hypothetical protein